MRKRAFSHEVEGSQEFLYPSAQQHYVSRYSSVQVGEMIIYAQYVAELERRLLWTGQATRELMVGS